MKTKVCLISVLVLMVVLLAGCGDDYFLELTYVSTSPAIAYVNEPIGLYAHYSATYGPEEKLTFYWEIEGYEEVYKTSGPLLNEGLTFDTPGIKRGSVRVEAESFQSNVLLFGFEVHEAKQ